jgi:putative addiction module component (TIGR02574 family)
LTNSPGLNTEERKEILLKLTELDGAAWLDADDPLTAQEKAILDARLAAYETDPDARSSWAEVEARLRA